MKPKSGEKEVTPKEFFGLWMPFCQEFKELWKREQKRICKERSVTKFFSFVLLNDGVFVQLVVCCKEIAEGSTLIQ